MGGGLVYNEDNLTCVKKQDKGAVFWINLRVKQLCFAQCHGV